MWKVYCYTTPSNKKYIGITHYSLEQRRKNGYNIYFSNAIKKYGIENITVEILADNLEFEKAQELEKYYIHLYNTTNPNFGYNITHGGDGNQKYDYYDIIEFYKNNNYNYQNTLDHFGCTSSTLLNILEGAGYNRKQIISDIHKEKIIKYSQNRSVLQYDLQGNFLQVFTTLQDAASAVGLNSTTGIIAVCNNKRNQSGGYYWRYQNEFEEIPKKLDVNTSKKQWKVQIEQYDLNNNLLNTFDSIAQANIYLGKNSKNSNISAACRGKRKSAYGYIWKYKESGV